MNRLIRRYLLGQISPNQNQELAEILNSQSDSPFWTRIYGGESVNNKYIDYVLNKYNAIGMIVGHTPLNYKFIL